MVRMSGKIRFPEIAVLEWSNFGKNRILVAYAIEYERKDANKVLRALKDTFKGTNQLLLTKLRYTHPNSFANAVKLQNKVMNETYVIPLNNVSTDEIFYLQPMLQQVNGIKDVVPTRKTQMEGRYNILLQQEFLANSGLLGKTRSGQLWTTSIITVIWTEWTALWALRNGIIHGHDAESRAHVERTEAEQNLHTVYAQRNNMLPRTRDILFDTLEEHLTHST